MTKNKNLNKNLNFDKKKLNFDKKYKFWERKIDTKSYFTLYSSTSLTWNFAKNQLQLKQAAERMRIKLRGPVEHSPWKPNPNIFADPGYANIYEIFVYFQMSNSQWRGARRILLFSGVFLYMTWTICGLNFVVLWRPLHNFSQKNPKNIPNIWLFWQIKTYGTKFG